MPIRFRFRWIPFTVTLLLVILGVTLAQWQTRRGNQKQEMGITLLQRQAAPIMPLGRELQKVDEIEYRQLSVQGEFIADWAIYLDNRPNHGIAGFYVLMPFKIVNSNVHVLVMRGWLPRDSLNRTKLQPYATPVGMLTIKGTARRDVGHVLQLGHAETLYPGAIVQNANLTEFSTASKLQFQPFVIEQTSSNDNTADGLLRDWPRPSLGIEKHRGYAFQWYALATMALIFFIVTGCRRETKKPSKQNND